MASFDPSMFEQRRRGLQRSYSADSAMNAYQRFLSQRRGERDYGDLSRTWEEETPKFVSSYSRRNLVGPNIRSGVFSNALQKFDSQRVRQLGRAREDMQQQDYGYELAGRGAASAYEDALLEMELDKYRQIQNDAMQLMQLRSGY
jgi:hypothetical protein